MSNAINTVVEKQALEQIDSLIKGFRVAKDEVINLSKEVRALNGNVTGIKTPSGLSVNSSANAQLIADMRKQSVEITNLQKQLTELNKTRQVSNQRTSEEIVNQRVLATNANRQAQATSALAGAYRNLSAQVAIASERYQNLIARGRAAGQSQRQFNDELARAQREFRTLQTRVLEADKAVDKWGRTGERSIGFAKNLLSAFGVVGGVTAIATITQDIFKQTKEIQSLDLALKTVTGSQQNFYESQVFLNRIAEAYGGNIGTLTTSFTQFYASAKDKLAGNEIKNIFESITKSAGFLGLSTEKQEKAFLALNQMMSKGTIQAEELRGQLAEALPNSMGIMTKAVQVLNPNMKVTEKTIAGMMKSGTLLSAEVLPEFARQMEISYGVDQKNRVETLTASTTRMGNSWTSFIRSLNDSETGGITTFFKFFADGITGSINGLIRLNSSFEELKRKGQQEGNDRGKKEAQKYIDNSVTNNVSSKDLLENLQIKENSFGWDIEVEKDKLKELNKELAEAKKLFSLFVDRKEVGEAKDKIEKQIEYVAYLEAQNQVIKDKIVLLKNPELKKEGENPKLTDAQIKDSEDYLRQSFENSKKELEIQVYKQQKIYENENNNYEDRLKALSEYGKLKSEITNLSYNEEVRLAKGNASKIKGAELDKKFQVLKNLEDYTDKREKLEIKLANTIEENGIKQIKIEDILAEARKKATLEMDAKIKKDEEAAEALKKLQSATEDYINSFKDGFLANAGLGSLQIFLDGTFQNLLKGADSLGEKFAVTFDAIGEVAQEAFAFINQASLKNFDEEYSRLEEQKNVSLLYAGESAEAKKKIEKDYEARKKEVSNREDKAKKKAALFNISVDTAQAVVSALARYDYISAVLFGVIGAAQYAAVSSQEIPKYFKGGIHKGGLAMINDAGGSNYVETVVSPDGTAKQYSGRNVVTNLEAGSEIFTPEQWQAKLMSPTLIRNDNSHNGGITENQVNKIVSAINNKTEYRQEFSESGIKTWFYNGQSKTQIMNDRFSFKQKSV
ncbi:MAG: tape measure protein [Ferruginibacter sp.]|nr:tape measure protein [Ferruginibacter sp.]